MPEYAVVGKRLPRVDALSKVTGSAIYSADISLPGMLYGKVLRSPYAHADIKRLDTGKAKALPGVFAVITAADVPGYKKKGELLFHELPHLARQKVVYAAQPVAVVAAITPEIAEEALGLIEVDYEVLEPVFDPLEAMKPDAPLIHPDLYTNLFNKPKAGEDKPSNIAHHLNYGRGDVEAGFQQADIVIENTFRTSPVSQGYLEPFSAIARADADGKLTIWTQSQGIFIAREWIADFLDIPASRIKVMPVEIGGAFGGKSYLPVAPLCGLLAMITGKPVKMTMTREENMKDGRPGAGSVSTVKLGITKDGLITTASIDIIYDEGAYSEMAHSMFTQFYLFAQYKIPNVRVKAWDVLTNKVPATFYRAPSAPQSNFAVESTMDLAARALNMDPIEFRLKNVSGEGDRMPNGMVLPVVGFKETLQRMSEYLKEKGPAEGKNRGRGIACGVWGGASGSFGANIIVDASGSLSLVVGLTDISGSRTSVAQIVAEEFCIPLSSVTVVCGDTDSAPWATMSVGSMTVYSVSHAVYRACENVKAQLSSIAASELGVQVSDIEFSKGLFQVKGNPSKSKSLKELASRTAGFGGCGPVTGSGSVGGLPPAPTISVHAADIEVDENTGKTKILSYAVVQDVGQAINPMSIEGQIQGAVTQGAGWAFNESYIFKDGVVQNCTLLDYRLPTAVDVPMIDVVMVEVKSKTGIYGLRHAGEPPMVPTLATMANAVQSATRARIKQLPMTPEAVLNAWTADKKL